MRRRTTTWLLAPVLALAAACGSPTGGASHQPDILPDGGLDDSYDADFAPPVALAPGGGRGSNTPAR